MLCVRTTTPLLLLRATRRSSLRLSCRSLSKRSPKIPLRAWLNPWADLALLIPPKELAERVFAYTQLWGLLSTLMCTASVTTLLGFPHCKGDDEKTETEGGGSPCTGPLLASIIPKGQLHDCYIGSCVCSFFVGGLALGMATVGSCTGVLIPKGSIKWFAIRHSFMLGTMPFLTVLSGGLLGVSVVIGVDIEDCGGVLSHLAVWGYAITSLLIAGVAVSGHIALVRSVAAASRNSLFRGWSPQNTAKEEAKRWAQPTTRQVL